VATTLGDWTRAVGRRRGRASMVSEAPVGVALKGKGVFPLEDSLGERARSGLASGPAGRGGRPIRRASAGATRWDGTWRATVLRKRWRR
jgi:hypothetical protein